MKSGTTSLADMLSKHPSIVFSKPKEPNFFTNFQYNWQENIIEYHKIFQKREGENILYGEGSTAYTYSDLQSEKISNFIYKYNKDMKIIYIIREPFSRIISQYIHTYERAYEKNKNINEAIIDNPFYLEVAKYYSNIKNYISLFGKENVLILLFEEVFGGNEEVAKNQIIRLSNFLNIDENPLIMNPFLKSNSFGEKRYNYKTETFLKSKYIQILKKIIPQRLRYLISEFLHFITRKKIYQKPILSEKAKLLIVENIKDDINELSKIMGKNLFEFWNIK